MKQGSAQLLDEVPNENTRFNFTDFLPANIWLQREISPFVQWRRSPGSVPRKAKQFHFLSSLLLAGLLRLDQQMDWREKFEGNLPRSNGGPPAPPVEDKRCVSRHSTLDIHPQSMGRPAPW